MELIISPTSPYARKALIVRLEKGLHTRVSVIEVSPFVDDDLAIIKNPLAKVPSLILADGSVLFDSPIICAYLDSLDSAPTLTSSGTNRNWSCERSQALGDGIMDAAFSFVMEQRRPKESQSDFWLKRWRASIEGGLDAMSDDIETRENTFDIGTVSCAVALAYLDFRLPHIHWRTDRGELKKWYEKHSARPSFLKTLFA